jgi:hypothetical protein
MGTGGEEDRSPVFINGMLVLSWPPSSHDILAAMTVLTINGMTQTSDSDGG